jgi:hypothetical protein
VSERPNASNEDPIKRVFTTLEYILARNCLFRKPENRPVNVGNGKYGLATGESLTLRVNFALHYVPTRVMIW